MESHRVHSCRARPCRYDRTQLPSNLALGRGCYGFVVQRHIYSLPIVCIFYSRSAHVSPATREQIKLRDVCTRRGNKSGWAVRVKVSLSVTRIFLNISPPFYEFTRWVRVCFWFSEFVVHMPCCCRIPLGCAMDVVGTASAKGRAGSGWQG